MNVVPIERASMPQVEDGFTRIANELYDAIGAAKLTLAQQSVVHAIIRKTYGYNKKEDDISASQIGDWCGMARTHVTNTLNELAKMNVITKRPGVYVFIFLQNATMDRSSCLMRWQFAPLIERPCFQTTKAKEQQNHR